MRVGTLPGRRGVPGIFPLYPRINTHHGDRSPVGLVRQLCPGGPVVGIQPHSWNLKTGCSRYGRFHRLSAGKALYLSPTNHTTTHEPHELLGQHADPFAGQRSGGLAGMLLRSTRKIGNIPGGSPGLRWLLRAKHWSVPHEPQPFWLKVVPAKELSPPSERD